MCIDTVPEGKYQYEIADDDESQGNPARVGIVMCEVGFISPYIFMNVYKT